MNIIDVRVVHERMTSISPDSVGFNSTTALMCRVVNMNNDCRRFVVFINRVARSTSITKQYAHETSLFEVKYLDVVGGLIFRI